MLKTLLHKTFTLVLAVAILFSATGITVFKMVCSKSNKFDVSLIQFENCCKKNTAAKCSLDRTCCDFSKNTVSSVQQFTQNDSFVINASEFDLPFSFLSFLQPEIKVQVVSSNGHVIPDSGRDILISVQQLLI